MALRTGRASRAALVLAPAGAVLLALTGCGGGSHGPAKVAAPAAAGADASTPASASPTPGDTANASPTASASATPACDFSALSARLAEQNAATGHDRLLIQLTNGSKAQCSLYGYPGVGLVDAQGKVSNITNDRGGDFTFPDVPAKTVDLAPGGVASFNVGMREIPGESEDCTDAAGVAVTPPGATTPPLKVTVAVTVCGGRVSVSPVVAGGAGVGS